MIATIKNNFIECLVGIAFIGIIIFIFYSIYVMTIDIAKIFQHENLQQIERLLKDLRG